MPEAQVKGLSGCNLIALIWSKKSAILRAESRLCIMAQKYKVYYNNRVIWITDGIDSLDVAPSFRISHYPGNNILEEWKIFKLDETIASWVLVGKTQDIWKEFRKLFKIIKAGGGLVKNSKEEYLFIFRNKKWDLPKGKMNKGEDIEETALREVEEECGIRKLKIVKCIGKSYHLYELKGEMALKKITWFEMSSIDESAPKPQEEEGIEKVVWVKPKEFKSWKGEMYPSVWDIVKGIE
jgi:hypothetical protein